MSSSSSTEKKATLLQDFELRGEKSEKAKTTSSWTILACLVTFFCAVFVAAFVGGFFLGKNQTAPSCDSETQSSSPEKLSPQIAATPKAFLVEYGGSQKVIPAYSGDEPIEDFVQCRSVMAGGRMFCSPSNPLLTPKGIVQLFIYQYREEVSLIVTGTGTNYGERVANASMMGESQVTVDADNFDGLFIQFADSYNTLYRTVPLPSQLAVDLDWGNVRSIGFALSLSNASAVDGTIKFQSKSNIPLNIRGAFMHDTEIPTLPESSTPLLIKAHQGEIPPENEPAPMTETPLFTDNDVSQTGFQMNIMQPSDHQRRRRSALLPYVPTGGFSFLSIDPTSGKLNHRVELHHENRQGGENGTVCWHVKNYVDQIEAHACLLFHDALYDGMETGNEPNDDRTRHHMLTTFHYRNMGDEKWNQTTIQEMDVMANDVFQGMRNRRSFGSFFSHLWQGIKNVGHKIADGVKTAFNAVKNGVETAGKKIWSGLKTAGEAIAHEAKKVVTNCGGIINTVVKAGKCIDSGVGCVGGVAGEIASAGADTLETVSSCVGAVSNCATFGKCF